MNLDVAAAGRVAAVAAHPLTSDLLAVPTAAAAVVAAAAESRSELIKHGENWSVEPWSLSCNAANNRQRGLKTFPATLASCCVGRIG